MKMNNFGFEHIFKHERGEEQPSYLEYRKAFMKKHYGLAVDYGTMENGLSVPTFRFQATCQACGHIVEYIDYDERDDLKCPLEALGFLVTGVK